MYIKRKKISYRLRISSFDNILYLILKRNIDSKTLGHNVKKMTSSENIGTRNNACQMNVYQTF